MTSDSATPETIAAEWMRVDSVLILTHERPDGDAVGSALGTAEFLRGCGKRADALLPEPLPERYRNFARAAVSRITPTELAAYEMVLLLDCANPTRIAAGELTVEQLRNRRFLNVDHHSGNTVPGNLNCVDATAAAASLLAYEIARSTGKPVSPETATLWYLGLVTDTGSFRFANTTPRALRVAAELLELGAAQEAVTNAVYFSKPRNQQLFEADLVANYIKLAGDGQVAYAVLPPELFAKHHFDMRDGEGIIDLLREIEGTVIAVLAHQRGENFKFSFRTKDCRLPVGPFARSLDGGGHEMAAGATVRLPNPAAAEAFILKNVPILLQQS